MLCCFFFYICCSCHHLIITSFVYIYVSPLLSETGKRKSKKSKDNADDDTDVYDDESGSGSDGDHILKAGEFLSIGDEEESVVDEEEEEGDPDDSDDDEDNGDETNTFKVREYIKNDQKEFPLVAYAVEAKISIGLLPMSFFVHQNEHFLFCEYTNCCLFIYFRSEDKYH